MAKNQSKFKNATVNTTNYDQWYHDLPVIAEEPVFGSFVAASSQVVAHCSDQKQISLTPLKTFEENDNLRLNKNLNSSPNFKQRAPFADLAHVGGSALRGLCFHHLESFAEPEYTSLKEDGGIKQYQSSIATAMLCSFSADKVGIHRIVPTDLTNFDVKSDVIFTLNCSDARNVSFNKACSDIVAVCDASTVILSDLSSNETFMSLETKKMISGEFSIDSFAFLHDGNSKAAAVALDNKSLSLFDLSSNKLIGTVEKTYSGKGTVQVECSQDKIFTVGIEKNRKRDLKIWDLRKMQKPSGTFNIDSNKGKAYLNLDADANLMHMLGRGDTLMSIFDLSLNTKPFVRTAARKAVSRKTSISSCLVPKGALDVYGCEVNRVLNLTKDSIETIRVEVPRKRRNVFYPELYPDVVSPLSSGTSAAEWKEFKGGYEALKIEKMNVLDVYKMKNGISARERKEKNIVQKRKTQQKKTEQRKLELIRDEAVEKDQQAYKRASRAIGYIPKYKNVKVQVPKKEETVFGLQTGEQCFDANNVFFAVNWSNHGNDIYINFLSAHGKVAHPPEKKNLISGQRTKISALKFDAYNTDRLVSGSIDGCIKVWTDLCVSNSVIWEVIGHTNSVSFLLFHPTVSGMLASSSTHHDLKLWDLTERADSESPLAIGKDIQRFGMNHADFDYYGRHLMALTKENNLISYELCPSKGKIVLVKKASVPSGFSKAGLALIRRIGEKNLFVLSGVSATTSVRQIKLFAFDEFSNTLTNISSVNITNGASIYVPHVIDESLSFFLTAKGESLIKVFEIKLMMFGPSSVPKASQVEIHKCNDVNTKQPGSREPAAIVSVTLPFRSNDPTNFEVANIVQYSRTKVDVVKMVHPRAESVKEFFADDLYPENTTISNQPRFIVKEFLTALKTRITSHEAIHKTFSPKRIATLNFDSAKAFTKANEETNSRRRTNVLKTRTRVVQEQMAREQAKKAEQESIMQRLTQMATEKNAFHQQRANDHLGLDSDDEWSD